MSEFLNNGLSLEKTQFGSQMSRNTSSVIISILLECKTNLRVRTGKRDPFRVGNNDLYKW